MAKFFLIIAPSGSGKTTICRQLAEENKNICFLDLDNETGSRTDLPNALLLGESIIKDIQEKDSEYLYLIDVGAGFQNAPDFYKSLESRADKVICLWVEPQEAYTRICGRGGEWRTLDRYTQEEYGSHRIKVYNLGVQIPNSGTLFEGIQTLKKYIDK